MVNTENKENKLTKQEFKQLRAEAGFKTDVELAKFFGISLQTVLSWNTRYNPYPYWLSVFFKLKKIEVDNVFKNFSLEELEAENQKLKQEFIFLKSLIKEKLFRKGKVR